MKQRSYLFSLLIIIVSIFSFSFACLPAITYASSWLKASPADPIGQGYWKDIPANQSFSSPHGGYTTTTNKCKVCHAVHESSDTSYKLIKSGNTTESRSTGEGTLAGMGNSKATSCMYCHDGSTGFSAKRPYELSALGITVRGEHRIGATLIPDSTVNGGTNGGALANRDPSGEGAVLQCYQCHSVHGGGTIGQDSNADGQVDTAPDGNIYSGSDAVENWNTKILRLDPAGDGTILAKGTGGLTSAEWTQELVSDAAAVRTGFCADCHDKNPSWSRTTDDSDRPNKSSHPQGKGVNSKIYSATTQTDAVAAPHSLTQMGCRGCHYASAGVGATSRFPHQSVSQRLLYDQMTAPLDVASNSVADSACLTCHTLSENVMGGYQAQEEASCFVCHENTYGAPNVKAELQKASAHPVIPISGKHKENTTETSQDFAAPNNRHAECADCHSAQNVYPWADNSLTGVWGIGVNNAAAGTTPTYSVKPQVTYEYELCFKCHSSWTTQPTSAYYSSPTSALIQGDKALEFNPNNSSFHPVETAGRNISANLNEQLASAGLSTSSVIKCSDCHNSDGTSDVLGLASNSSFKPKGPHGSTYGPILRANGNGTYNNGILCFKCHDYNKLLGSWSYIGGARTNFINYDGAWNLHLMHMLQDAYTPTCSECHYNIHSNQQSVNTQYIAAPSWQTTGFTIYFSPPPGVKTHLVNFAPWIQPYGGRTKPEFKIDTDNGRRWCYLSCHGYVMIKAYLPHINDDPWTY